MDAKRLLAEATTLAHPDPNLPLSLFTDASQHSIGSVLMQRQNGKFVPLGYFSRHLPIEKANWAVYRKELLACQASVRYFISEIYGYLSKLGLGLANTLFYPGNHASHLPKHSLILVS